MSEKDNIDVPRTVNFIRNIIADDLKSGKHKTTVTRFPPEPNGYLHIGHAKSICLNFGTALEHEGGSCFLRFDDTNPETEDIEYINSIKADVRWLGFDWGKNLTHASDYFDQLYQYAVDFIKQGKAYVCSLNADQIRQYRGNLKEPGKESPYRKRTVEENLELFEQMKNGDFKDGEHVLRAKIDMASPNINMRDPVMYRIKHMTHPATGDKWCIYPMYDYTHCVSDALEKITHSLCTLEFEDHRPLYDWYLNQIKTPCHPRQIEFSRLNLNYTITSKRKLKQLVEEGHVKGWDDPRMSTLVAVRRRGFTPRAIRNFCELVGISKSDSVIDMSLLEEAVRSDLNKHAPRAFAVLRPLKVVIENFPENEVLQLDVANHPSKPEMGTRKMPFSRELYIEADDYMENPPKDFFRLGPGKEVRLRYAYILKCNEAVKDKDGKVVELRCTIDLNTLGKNPEGRKVKGIIHWVSVKQAVKIEARLYDRLFSIPNPAADDDFIEHINPNSLEVIASCFIEPAIANSPPESHFQFERLGYFFVDPKDSRPGSAVFNRTVTLRDGWTAKA